MTSSRADQDLPGGDDERGRKFEVTEQARKKKKKGGTGLGKSFIGRQGLARMALPDCSFERVLDSDARKHFGEQGFGDYPSQKPGTLRMAEGTENDA